MAVNEKLARRISEFLPNVRVGIDFGEWAGGIAVVRGNTILHASTYLDFHAADLEQRRTLRRGRRTRHAKKMRLARLRSWVLRSKLPDGSRLPDPRAVMHDPAFMVQPGVFQQEGQDPNGAPNWVELCKHSQVGPAGFVRALTLLFQKRGYRWDDRGPKETSDKELEEFLTSARIPDDELASEIENEIARRRENPQDPARGRKGKVPPERLQELLKTARNRSPEPRVAEHRRVREADLREVVEGFGRKAGLNDATITRWQRELAGERGPDGKYVHYGLLNRVLRLTRFDNRLKTTCAWCEKKTPRKAKVRELAYQAALNNLRTRAGGRMRPLNSEERKPFEEWWSDRAAAPGVETIGRRIARFNPKQKKMARQFWDLLKNDTPKGRANLCQEHLAMAAQDPDMSMRKAGVPWQTLRVRQAPNPCREAHDRRVLAHLERVLFKPGRKGQAAWRYGPVSLITLEVPEPRDEERAKPGEQKERKLASFRERLATETKLRCVYCNIEITPEGMAKDHIFPRSRGGPDIWNNMAAACRNCNDTKGDRTPFEWFGDTTRWSEFLRHVDSLGLSPRKQEILVGQEPDYPDNPTPLAHVGSRPRQFIRDLRKVFEHYGVPPPEIFLETGKPHVQRVEGRWTFRARKSWGVKPDGSPDFPPKERADLRNHAQDAALLAACPPHTWREHIWVHSRKRQEDSGKVVEESGLAAPEIAPDWAAFEESTKGRIVYVLGNYSARWRRSLAAETLWADPLKIETPRVKCYKPIDAILVSQAENIVSPFFRQRFQELAHELGIEGKKRIPKEKLTASFPGVRRLRVEVQKMGVPAQLCPDDGPVRKVQVRAEAASEGAVFWHRPGSRRKTVEISIRRPEVCKDFGLELLIPPVPPDAEVLGEWKRHEFIELPADYADGHPAGWYRVKEFSSSGVIVLHESALPVEIARRVGVDADAPVERKLGKGDLATFFEARRKRDGGNERGNAARA